MIFLKNAWKKLFLFLPKTTRHGNSFFSESVKGANRKFGGNFFNSKAKINFLEISMEVDISKINDSVVEL